MSWKAAAVPPLIGYVVEVMPGGIVKTTQPNVTSIEVTGLKSGVAYSVSVRAVSARGASASSQTSFTTVVIAEKPEVAGLIVKYEPGTPVTEAPGVATGSDAVPTMDFAPGKAIGFGMRTVKMPVAVSEKTAEKLADQLERAPEVISAEPDYVLKLEATTKAVGTATVQTGVTWGLDRIDQPSLPLSATYTYDSNGSGVTAYIVDTGIRADHVEFTGRVGTGFTAIADGSGTNDRHGHGTHVAGTVAGTTYGVAKSATLVPVRVLDANGSGTSSGVIQGLNWIVQNHAAGVPAVANMSLGGGADSLLDAAVRGVVADGVTMVVAAGNSAANSCSYSPARVAEAITVNASTNADTNAYFSNYGSCSDIYAPGLSITSAWLTSPTAAAILSGTSMASPHVAGVAARILSANPTWTPDQVWSRISATASTVNFGLSATGDPNKLLYIGLADIPLTAAPTPTISGSAVVGQTLTAVPGSWAPAPVTLSYQWNRNGVPIAGATASTLVLGAADLAASITVSVTGNKVGYISATTTSAAVTVVGAAVTGVSVAPASSTVLVGATVPLTATVAPAWAANKSVTWASWNRAVATVDANGLVTAVAPGSAVIVATTVDGGFSASSVVNVVASVSGVTVAPSAASVRVGATTTLVASVIPSTATNKAVTWSSSNPAVATVNASGVVTGIAAGGATVTATTADGGFKATSAITVVIPVTGVTVTPTSLNLNAGATSQLTAAIAPTNASNKSVTWSSSNPAVATVSTSGLVAAVGSGTATITVTTSDGGFRASTAVSVTVRVNAVTISPSSLQLRKGQAATLTANIFPANATNRAVTWSSSNPAVASVSNSGVVSAKTRGSATITVVTVDGAKRATAFVDVLVPVSGVKVNQPNASVPIGRSVSVKAVVSPEDATNRSVGWTSSNSAIATVDANGVVTAKAPGKVQITAVTIDGGMQATADVTVPAPKATRVELSASKADKVAPGDRPILTARVVTVPEGQPVAGATVTFARVASGQLAASAVGVGKVITGANGYAQLSTGFDRGATTWNVSASVSADAYVQASAASILVRMK